MFRKTLATLVLTLFFVLASIAIVIAKSNHQIQDELQHKMGAISQKSPVDIMSFLGTQSDNAKVSILFEAKDHTKIFIAHTIDDSIYPFREMLDQNFTTSLRESSIISDAEKIATHVIDAKIEDFDGNTERMKELKTELSKYVNGEISTENEDGMREAFFYTMMLSTPMIDFSAGIIALMFIKTGVSAIRFFKEGSERNTIQLPLYGLICLVLTMALSKTVYATSSIEIVKTCLCAGLLSTLLSSRCIEAVLSHLSKKE
ncbi:hypothetical protein [Vibrio sp. D431a]|uniref:hypothetical protein n=1 Tax=Vibrio sp. D431a TaxID=2837388 RepID=UPI002555E177|nr:hypothetical protein [Vibrio sp. D431a]MDK9790699.1 hypothetical protein [Vibrio sp. D431a]